MPRPRLCEAHTAARQHDSTVHGMRREAHQAQEHTDADSGLNSDSGPSRLSPQKRLARPRRHRDHDHDDHQRPADQRATAQAINNAAVALHCHGHGQSQYHHMHTTATATPIPDQQVPLPGSTATLQLSPKAADGGGRDCKVVADPPS
ncbi:hypothetical protein ACJQWK_09274 [Exserohilum turcicum]